MKSFVFGSAGYPEPKFTPSSCFDFFISSSLFSFARMEAAETVGWLRSALCSQTKFIFFGFFRSFSTSFDQLSMFVEGQSMNAVTCSSRSFVRQLIIMAVLMASK